MVANPGSWFESRETVNIPGEATQIRGPAPAITEFRIGAAGPRKSCSN